MNHETDKHGVHGDLQLRVDLFHPPRAGESVVAGEGVDAARGRGRAGCAANQTEEDERQGEDEGAGLVANGRTEDHGERLGVGVIDEGGDFREDKVQRQQEDEAEDEVHEGCADHGFRNLGFGRLYFLRHAVRGTFSSCSGGEVMRQNSRDDHAGGRGGVCCV